MAQQTPPRSISAFRSLSPSSSLDSQDGDSEDSFVEEASVVHAATVVTTGSDSTRGFTLIEKKQYISDIIAGGGLYDFDFATLVKEKPSYYADCPAVPKRREKFYNLWGYWKRNPATYGKLLRQFGLQDKALGLKTPPPRTPKSPAPKSSSGRKPKARRTPVRNGVPAPAPAPAPPAVAPPPQVIRHPAPPLFHPQPSLNMANSNANSTTDLVATLRLRAVSDGNMRTANTICPEKNGGVVTITTVPLVPHDGTLRTSYILSLEADFR